MSISNMLQHCILGILCLGSVYSIQAQCPTGQVEIEVEISTDNWGHETSWNMVNATTMAVYHDVAFGTYGNNSTFNVTFCVPDTACLIFTILDDYGDGIYSPGGYTIKQSGTVIASTMSFTGSIATEYFNCVSGQVCEEAIIVSEGSHTAPHANYWYEFTPDSVGTYRVTTCGLTACDTRIWIYDDCLGIDLTVAEEGTIFYNNDNADCGIQADIPNAIMVPGTTYYIRIGDLAADCAGSPINWILSYEGPVAGCTDPLACNFNPLATVSDTCIYPGSPDCPDGPDLLILKDPLVSSMNLSNLTVTSGSCLVSEECVTGYGDRNLIRFDTHIFNQGNTDYYIGNPADNPDQFETMNCHGHTHYKGYAEYILFDDLGNPTPVGFKNGFCVMDIYCTTGSWTYGCSTMGISAGCADVYGSGTSCNWIDITDIDTGTYTFVARTNWDQDPDGLGRHETDYFNNWAQVCLYIGEDPIAGPYFTIDTTCAPYIDCAGDIYGDAYLDCNGDCNGGAVMGDLNTDGLQELVDVYAYTSGIVGDDLSPVICNDLNSDGDITVSDAALLSSCIYFSTGGHTHTGGTSHDHCNLPTNLLNIYDTVSLSIGAVNWDEGYLDVYMNNEYSDVAAYEFDLEGLSILSVESLTDPDLDPFMIDHMLGGQKVIGLTTVDSVIDRSIGAVPLCRVYWFELTASEICISEVIDVVNGNYEDVIVRTQDACRLVVTTVGIETEFNPLNVHISPNPFSSYCTIQFPNPNQESFDLEIRSTTGALVKSVKGITQSSLVVQADQLPSGPYIYTLNGAQRYSGTLMIID